MFEENMIQVNEAVDEAADVEAAEEAIDEEASNEAVEAVEEAAMDTDVPAKTYSSDEVGNLIDGAIVVGAGIGVVATTLTAAAVKVGAPIVKKGFAKAKTWIQKKKEKKALDKAAWQKAREELAAANQGKEEA